MLKELGHYSKWLKVADAVIEADNPMKNNIRIVPIQKLCVLCGNELQARDMSHGLAGQLCRACIRLLSEQVFVRELERQPKIVQM